jgi:hypothetical protein
MIHGVAMKRKKKLEMDKETQKDTKQKMQKKDNAPCNNQLKRTKRKEDKKKLTFDQEICLPKVPPKEPGSNRISTT